jgi:hypothetical protein
MKLQGDVCVEQKQDGRYVILDEAKTELLVTEYAGLAFILEDILANRGSEIDLEEGWIS